MEAGAPVLPALFQHMPFQQTYTRKQHYRVPGVAAVFISKSHCFCFQGTLLLDDGRLIKLEYSRYDTLDGRSSSLSGVGDWMCAKVCLSFFLYP
ncbi:unnamed protein product [Gongylonema pulchrum]|uniref:BEACH-type PH domain-containing protein n=1 Tax=Gongylonema pulchrum TaxID=637853 RepID=A0A183ESL3_9BILA|nr:unnamed protein product [Gongylonema pulchrum]